MKKPLLVVMAAGMGSRYGSLKQIDPVGPSGEVIIDYSVYDAVRAGFEKVIFIIKKDFEKEFKKAIGERFAGKAEVLYAYQELTDLPDGFDVPQNRQKPWGTSQAVLSARHLIDAPFAVINADDYYGPHAFKIMYDYLANLQNENEFAMVGYQIENTLTENGTVSRGVCEINENGLLQ
ncbi:MAG: sugar phosphate nucleotidyltransferase, partial [Oscillospiraceae bacterium]